MICCNTLYIVAYAMDTMQLRKYIRRIELNAPEYGNVRIMKVTENNTVKCIFSRSTINTRKDQQRTKQLLLF